MGDTICINGRFPPEKVEFYKQHGVITPEQDKFYTIRKLRQERGKIGVLLEEIINPEVPIQTMSGIKMIEPSWDSARFATLLGKPIEFIENETELEEEFAIVKEEPNIRNIPKPKYEPSRDN